MRHLLQSLASTGAIQAVNLLTGILAARLLLPEGRGELAIVMLWPNLMLTIGFLSLDQAVIYHSAREGARTRAVFLAALLPGALLMLATAAICWMLLPWILEPRHGELVSLSRTFLLVSTPLHLITNLLMAVLLGRQELRLWNLLRLVQPLAYLIGLLALWALGLATVAGAMVAFLIGAGLTLVFLLPAGLRHLPAAEAAAKPVGAVLGFAGRAHFQSLCLFASRRIDQALIALYLLASDLGLYVVALALASALETAAGTISMVAFPKISNLAAAEGKQVLLGRYFRFTLALLAAGAVALWLLGEWLLVLLFGAPFREAGAVLRILVLASVVAGLAQCLSFGYKAHDRIGAINQGAFLSLVAAAPAFWLLLPSHGLLGAAWAMLVVQAIPLVYMLLRLPGALGMSPWELFLPTREDAELLRRYRDSLRARLR